MNKPTFFLIFFITIMQCSNSFASAANPSQTDLADHKGLLEKCRQVIDDPQFAQDVLALREGTLENVNKKYGPDEDTMLMMLVKLNEPELFALAMAQNPDVNAVNKYNDTALGLACFLSCDSNIIQALLDAGANVHHINIFGFTPLMQAALSRTWRQRDPVNVIRGIQYLVNKGANINYKNNEAHSSTALVYAVISYHVPLVLFLLENNVIVDEKATIAINALKNGDNLLGELGISKEERKRAWAQMKNAFEIYASGQKVPYYNSKKNDTNSDSDTDKTESNSDTDEKEQYENVTSLMMACHNGNQEDVEKLLQDASQRSTIDATDNQLQTALHYCFTNPNQSLWQKQHNIIKKLIAAGAKVDMKDQNNFTPLKCAVHHGRFDAAQVLHESGADINEACQGISSMTNAIFECNVLGVDWLLKHNCSLFVEGLPVLGYALNRLPRITTEQKNKTISITKLLLDKTYEKFTLKNKKMHAKLVDELLLTRLYQIKLLKTDHSNLTLPMLIACLNFEAPELMQHIVSQEVHKKSINEKNRFGKSALDYAREHGHTNIAKILCTHGAKTIEISLASEDTSTEDQELQDARVAKIRAKNAAKKTRQIANAQKRNEQETIAKKAAPAKAQQAALLAAASAQAHQTAASAAASAPALPIAASATTSKDSKILQEPVDQTPASDETYTAAQTAQRMQEIKAAKEKEKTKKAQLHARRSVLEKEIKALNEPINNTSHTLDSRLEKAIELQKKYYDLHTVYKNLNIHQNKNAELQAISTTISQLETEITKQKQLQSRSGQTTAKKMKNTAKNEEIAKIKADKIYKENQLKQRRFDPSPSHTAKILTGPALNKPKEPVKKDPAAPAPAAHAAAAAPMPSLSAQPLPGKSWQEIVGKILPHGPAWKHSGVRLPAFVELAQ